MIVIGVTGGVGTGKSAVSRMLGEQGAYVLDADKIAHEMMRPGTAVWRRIRSVFGEGILSPSGQIVRPRLGRIVFSDLKQLEALCRIVHPAVRRRMQERMRAIRRSCPKAVVVLDIPLLMEAGSAYKVDALVVVSARMKVVAQRLKERSGWPLAEIKRRQASQLPLGNKERLADFVVRNDGSLAATRRRVIRIWKQIVKEKD